MARSAGKPRKTSHAKSLILYSLCFVVNTTSLFCDVRWSFTISPMELNESAVLKDIWSVIVEHTNLYDTIFLQASSKWLNKLCKEYRPFPKYHVLDQDMCMTYLIKIGSISCLDYVKNTLHFEWTSKQSVAAIECGQVSVLKHLRSNGCPFDQQMALKECTRMSCSLDMIKYLHESGSSWQEPMDVNSDPDYVINYGSISDMATHGHIDCIKYAMQNGFADKKVHYTPSMECLEFLVQHRFNIHSAGILMGRQSVTEYAASTGNLTMLKYAHQVGVPISTMCAVQAANEGHVECLKYALENIEDKSFVPSIISTIECFKYLLEKFGREVLESKLNWRAIGQTTHVEYLQYIINSGISLPSGHKLNLLLLAAVSSTEMLNFIFNNVPYERLTQQSALLYLHDICVGEGNLEGLKLLLKWNLPSSSSPEKLISAAITSGNIDMLKYVWEKYYQEGFDIQESLSDYPTPEMIDFLVERGAKPTSDHLQQAAYGGSLRVISHLIHLGCQWNDSMSTDEVPELCLKYLREHSSTNVNYYDVSHVERE